MKKKKKSKDNNISLKFIFLGLVFIIIALFFILKPEKNLNSLYENKIYDGQILKANNSAVILDEISTNKNLVISPTNIFSPIISLANVSDNNTKKEIDNFFNEDAITKNNSLLKNCQPLEQSKSEISEYYEKLIDEFNKKTLSLKQNQIEKMSNTNKQSLLLLLKKINESKKVIDGKSNLTSQKIDSLTLTQEELKKDSKSIFLNIQNIKEEYENYTIKNKVLCLNNIYYDKNKIPSVDDNIIKNFQDNYFTNLYGYNFSENATLKDINNYYKNNTSNKINYVLDYSDLNQSSLIAIGTTYFNYKWSTPIDSNITTPEEFYYKEDKSETVEMMHTTESIYLENDNAKGFIKHFEDNKYSFVGILPNEYNKKASELNIDNLLESKKENTNVFVSLPKFSFTSSISLRDFYEKNNIKDLFNKNANLNLLTTNNIYLSNIYNKIYIEIGDKGTTSTSLNNNEIKSYVLDNQNKELTFNRPFYFLILDNQTSSVLLIGQLINP